jgi:hypothetical protein
MRQIDEYDRFHLSSRSNDPNLAVDKRSRPNSTDRYAAENKDTPPRAIEMQGCQQRTSVRGHRWNKNF